MIKFLILLFSKIKINPYFWVVIFFGVITGYFRTLILLFIIVFVHEMGHVLAAYHYQWRIKKIELLPFGGVAEVEEYGNRPFKEELIVIISGPLQHVWMLVGAYLFHNLGLIEEGFYISFIQFNIMLLAFNLLPIWPLDGGKLLFLFFAKEFPYKKAHRFMLFTSFSILIILLGFCTLVYPFQLNIWIITIFLLLSHYTECNQQHFLFMRFLLERLYRTNKRPGKIKTLIVEPNKQIKDVLSLFYKGYYHEVLIKGSYTFKKISEDTLLHTMFIEDMPNPKLKDIMHLS